MTSDDLLAELELARREARRAFGDERVLIEKLILRPRHLEVAVAGDRHGNLVHLYERECSIQRNYQKVIEEAPAPDCRARSGQAARARRRLSRARSATTIWARWSSYSRRDRQAVFPGDEHAPAGRASGHRTVTGLDLVEWQIRIASGEPLPFKAVQMRARGHAIEARVTDRARRAWIPAGIGPILAYREPLGIRVDSGVAAGSEVTQFYNSMVAKVIAYGADREAARVRLAAALRNFTLLGPATTLQFSADCLDHPLFVEGQVTTRFIEEAFPGGWSPTKGEMSVSRAQWRRFSDAEARPAAIPETPGKRSLVSGCSPRPAFRRKRISS